MSDVTLRIPTSVLVIGTVILVGGALGAVGFLLGRDSAKTVEAAQIAAGATAADLERGRAAGYDEGFGAGKKAGRSYGEGVAAGRSDGYDKGYSDGAADALGRERFDLSTGAYYIVQFADGDHGEQLQIDDVASLLPGRAYEICNTYEVCYR